MSERHRAWVDHVAQLFGGLDICAIELLVGKDGREYIIEVNDSALSLMGDSQEEDRRHIADLVTAKMQVRRRRPIFPFNPHAPSSARNSSLIRSSVLFLGMLSTPKRVDEDYVQRVNVWLQSGNQPSRRSPCSANSASRIAREHGIYGKHRKLSVCRVHGCRGGRCNQH